MGKKNLPYRPCVGIMVLNRKGLVWVGHRTDNEESRNDEKKMWQMPQGGIDKGEDPLPAARRELFEETGIKTVSYLGEIREWLVYDLPLEKVGIALRGKYRGQKQRWFAFRFEGEESEIDISQIHVGGKPEFDRWDWVEMESLPDLIVPFKRRIYKQVVTGFRHLVED